MLKSNALIACILSGGKALRLGGQVKSFIAINKKPVIEWQLRVLRKYFDEIVLIGHCNYTNIRTIHDIIKDVGPIGGLHTALKTLGNKDIFVFPSDNPFISELLIKSLLAYQNKTDYDAVIPIHEEKIEPLYGIYRHTALPVVEKMLVQRNYSLHNLLQNLKVMYFPWKVDPDKTFFNINYPEDIQKAKKYAGEIISA